MVIPAIKKNAVIPDQLIKKLDGITLIQRALNTALEVTVNQNILVVTDSEEISVICERNNIEFYKDSFLKLNSENIIEEVIRIVEPKLQDNILLYRANTPLVDSTILRKAYSKFQETEKYILTSVKKEQRKILKLANETLENVTHDEYYEEIKAFHIFSRLYVNNKKYKPFVLDLEKSIEIESYQDWWVCEKVLQRKRIVFNVPLCF